MKWKLMERWSVSTNYWKSLRKQERTDAVDWNEELPDEVLCQFTSQHYCAGAVFSSITDKCVDAAPVIRWMVGKQFRVVADYCKRKGIKFAYVKGDENGLLQVE